MSNLFKMKYTDHIEPFSEGFILLNYVLFFETKRSRYLNNSALNLHSCHRESLQWWRFEKSSIERFLPHIISVVWINTKSNETSLDTDTTASHTIIYDASISITISSTNGPHPFANSVSTILPFIKTTILSCSTKL